MMDIDSLSVRTVEVHRAHMMGKLGANNLIDLVKRAIALGLVDLPAKLSLLAIR
jgi:DNA-binding CsgD family transcriptional regulator